MSKGESKPKQQHLLLFEEGGEAARDEPAAPPAAPTENQESPVVQKKARAKPAKKPAKRKSEEKRHYAWTELYEARMSRLPPKPASDGAPRGRPPRTVPVKQTSMRLTENDQEALAEWQGILTSILGRKPSLGETSGIVARMLSERFHSIRDAKDPVPVFPSLGELVDYILGEG